MYSVTGSLRNLTQPGDADSILLNVAGKLLMFQRDRSNQQAKPKDKDKDRPVNINFYKS